MPFDRAATRQDATALGFRRQSPIDAIRSKCRECMDNSYTAIEECTSIGCPIWPFRFGVNPWVDERAMTDEQREAASARLAAARANKA